jgi:hypothetical protein
MRTGIIVVFNSNEKAISKDQFIRRFKKAMDIKFCLINNNYSESFGETLMDIADECKNVSIIHLKKNKEYDLAVRLGARYMNNQFNLKILAYIVDLYESEMLEAIELFFNHREEIKAQQKTKQRNKLRPLLNQRLFSVSNYFKHGSFRLDKK